MLRAANITAACNLPLVLADARPQLLVLSEIRVTAGAATEAAQAGARRAGGSLLVGPPAAGGEALVAVFVRGGVLRPGAFSRECASFGGRMGHWRWVLPGAVVQVFGCYGAAGHGDDADGGTGRMVHQAVEWAETLGGPAIVAGDLNVHAGRESWGGLLAAAGWRDVGARSGDPTCIPSRGLPSRVDRLLVSPGVAPWCGELLVEWGLGLPVHGVLELPLLVPAGGQVLRARPGAALHGPARAGWETAAAGAEANARAVWEAGGPGALADGRLEDAWTCLCGAMRELLADRVGVPPSAAGRRVRSERQVPPAGPEGDALTRAGAAALLRARRLRQLAELWPEGPGALPFRAAAVLHAARRAEAPGTPWCGRLAGLGCRKAAVAAVADAAADADVAITDARQGRRDR